MSFCVFHAVQLGGLQSQLGGLQSTLAKLQAEQDDPEQACADQGLTDDECILYIKSLGGRIRSVQTQIASVQTQVANVQQGLTAQGCPTSPIVGADGAPLTVEADSQGHITSAEAVGNDGVKRTFKRTFTYEPGEKGGNWYYGVLRQEYFENDQRYLYATSWSYLWGRKLAFNIIAGDTMWGYSINFPDDDSHNEVPITISNGKFGQQATVTMGQLSLNQGSLAAPSFTGDFTPPAEIEQQVNKVSYFQQLFDREGEQLQVEQASALQTAGINVNMTFNEVLFKGPSWGKVAAIVGCWAIGGAISVIATKGLRFVTGPAGGAVGAFCNIVVDKLWRDPSPPNPANMTPMPSNPSVPVDLGNNMSDPGGGTTVCVPPPGSDSGEIILPPLGGGTENTVVPFEETTTVCL